MKKSLCLFFLTLLAVPHTVWSGTGHVRIQPANTQRGTTGRVIHVDLVVLEQLIQFNRLGAQLPNGQIFALARDLVPADHPFDEHGIDRNLAVDSEDFEPDQVRLRSYKRPRPVTLRANVGDTLEIRLRNLLPPGRDTGLDCNGKPPQIHQGKPVPDYYLRCAGIQVMGLNWAKQDNGRRIAPGEKHLYSFVAEAEGVFMLYSPNGSSIPNSQLDYGLFGAVNVQPEEAEWYRSQVTREDLELATYRVSERFLNREWKAKGNKVCGRYLGSRQSGLSLFTEIRRKAVREGSELVCPGPGESTVWELRVPTLETDGTAKISEVVITRDGYLKTLAGQPVIDYQAMYQPGHPRAGSPVLNMLAYSPDEDRHELAHSDLTAIVTGPQAGRFPYYLNSPSFAENPATPDRRQPYREFTVAYHISPHTQQAFAAFDEGPLAGTLKAGEDGFAINYGIAGIAPEIYANRTHVGPMGINRDGVDLLFEEFFLSSWAVGDPAMVTDIAANNPAGARATRALYPDDPSNVYHSYMRDHVKMRVLNTGSVAPHVHHQHAHQWLHTPNSDDGHYLDSQMIHPGSTYTMEMTYNGSGNRNQTVGDSIFHCHIYPHFAQGMWSLWRVHDVLEAGSELDVALRPRFGARALPDGEIQAGTPIPALVPLPSIAMAPLPAQVRLVDNGRRAEVLPEGTNRDGSPRYGNPGFPFFVPGVAGHRAPHPPLDFAWQEERPGLPRLYTEKTAGELRKPGDPMYLDGGLPRHLVLGGEVAREFHTRWDFTKNIAVYDQEGRLIEGGLVAMELPEQGTPVEQAAMAAHARRTHASYQPDGLPGNFILNGLPPVPGAPYAAPDVDDNGNSNFDARRFQAAVVQMDVVFNKEGWHYPQQRFITLLDDVKDTIAGKKPPEPFFFRANTGETIEFWHTNLVPKYYELDDFQVRTPTDILGQHIHLVKFDVTSSDGAGNGFNYEDGTFSPDEVRERIDAINANGGLYRFDPATQSAGGRQSRLRVVPYRESFGKRLGRPPAGQDWDGAQTTIQRFDTDPLLNHQGEDRTLRTVFTHDHFGPSTHQQVGLYGALLVEPAGSVWKDTITGQAMRGRSDGGPTSWQAIIETNDPEQSYREFAIAVADLQLSYQAQSRAERRAPNGIWFSTPDNKYAKTLNEGRIPGGLQAEFGAQGAALTDDARVRTIKKGSSWELSPNGHDLFRLSLSGGEVQVTTLTMEPGWADAVNAVWPPPACDSSKPGCGLSKDAAPPYPQIISDPGGGGNIGGWLVNYRNEPLDSRVQGPAADAGAGPDLAQDLSFAYSSITRTDPRLNRQPEAGEPIDPSNPDGFRYPRHPLLPRGEAGMHPTDPYTPLLRAYANDKVEVRTVVGAVDSPHSFQIQGMHWLAEPSYDNSGFRDVQGFGISEHYEMIFQLPPAGAGEGARPFVDYLYAPSSSTQGLAKGSWGILRSYQAPVEQLAELPGNPVAGARGRDFYQPPDEAQICEFNISARLNKDGTGLQYQVDGAEGQPLVLRANAGDWIRIHLTNQIDPQDAAKLKIAPWDPVNNPKSVNTSSERIQPYATSPIVGLHAMQLAYDTTRANGINVGFNGFNGVGGDGPEGFQTVPPGQTRTFEWYAGDIRLGADGQRRLIPIEFGALNLMPSDPLLQQSYGLYGALIIEPAGTTWDAAEAHALTATIRDADGEPLFTELVVLGKLSSDANAPAGGEVRFRVLNPGAGAAGQMTDAARLIAIEGHGWPEEPYTDGSTRIGDNPLTQWLGTQQVTALESYNLVLPSAGGLDKVPGAYGFYYYPQGPSARLGTLTVPAGYAE